MSQLVVTVLSFGGFLRIGKFVESRNNVLVFGAIWILLIIFEFVVFFSNSFILFPNEGNQGVPLFKYLNEWHGGQRFSHAVGGGIDILAVSDWLGEFVSLERSLLSLFPFWVANALHKATASGLAFAGAYLIGRRVGGIGRHIAFALAGLYAVGYYTHHQITWINGLSYALTPLFIYLVVFRIGKPYHYLSVVAAAALYATSSTPLHSFVAFVPSILACAFVVGPRRAVQVLPALLIFFLFILLNWHETLWGIISVAPLSARGTEVVLGFSSVGDALRGVWAEFVQMREFLLLLPVALSFIAIFDRRLFLRAVLAISLILASTIIFMQVPWSKLSIGPLRSLEGFNFMYFLRSLYPLTLLLCVLAIRAIPNEIKPALSHDRTRSRWLLIATAMILALAVGRLAWFKTYNAAVWLSEGGQTQLTKVEVLKNQTWRDETPKRVVSVPYRLPVNLAPAYGLDSFDGVYSLALTSVSHYWSQGIAPTQQPIDPRYTIESAFDPKCCKKYDLSQHINLDLLKIANVGYVLSVLPLEGGGLRQIAGPKSEFTLPRSGMPLTQRIYGYAKEIFKPNPVRVYALPDSLPRVFSARAVRTVPANTPDSEFIRIIARHALTRTAVWRTDEPGPINGIKDSLQVLEFDLVGDGFLSRVKAPDRGMIVFNVPHSPFWRAYIDGREAESFPVNMIHTGVIVPSGATHVNLRYRRPLLRDKIKSLLDFG